MESQAMSFGDHLEELRKTLFRIIAVTALAAVAVFCMKDATFDILLAPSKCDFVTYRWIERVLEMCGTDFHFSHFDISLIATDLSAQFMTHVTSSCYLGLLAASPYVLYEVFRFVSPALYDNERHYAIRTLVIVYTLFVIGLLMSYFVLFPISFRFLATYSVSAQVTSTITIDSYIDTFVTLTLLMGVVFQLPVIAYALGRMGIIDADLMSTYRRHAFILIMIVAAIITPPDIMTLILVTIPLYMLYELSIVVLKGMKTTRAHS